MYSRNPSTASLIFGCSRTLIGGDDLAYYAVSLLGPRATVERLTAQLPLLR